MIKLKNKKINVQKRHLRVRKKISGTPECPRLAVYRSLKHIYAQIINDENGTTLVSCNSKQKQYADTLKNMTNKEQARFVGEQIAKLAKKKKIINMDLSKFSSKAQGLLGKMSEVKQEISEKAAEATQKAAPGVR